MMNRCVIAFVLPVLCLPVWLCASQIEVAGDVSGNWSVDTVLVVGDITVVSGETLIIDPGTLILFEGSYTFAVEGQVRAVGAFGQPIRFTVTDTTGLYNLWNSDGAWGGLWFNHVSSQNDSSLFAYCTFEYGKAGYKTDSLVWYGGAVCVRESNRIRFSHCNFHSNRAFKNGGALYARKSALVIEHCSFTDNFCGLDTLYGYGGGLCLEYSDASVRNCLFEKNRSTGVGGGLSYEYSNPYIANNIFYDNFSAIGGGMVCLRSNGSRPVVNNLVYGNHGYFFGGGIAVLETNMLFANNTIAENSAGAGGGLYFNHYCFSVFKNCILWNNSADYGTGPQVYIWDTFSAPEFYWCDVEGGSESFGGTGGQPGGFIGVYENNLEIDPEFTNAGEHPFSIEATSPCINAGTPDTTGLFLPMVDLAGNIRFTGSLIDIGAYEYQHPTSLYTRTEDTFHVSVASNPFRDHLRITVSGIDYPSVNLALFDMSGKMVFEKVLNPAEGSLDFVWNSSDGATGQLLPGVYLCTVSAGAICKTIKVVYLG